MYCVIVGDIIGSKSLEPAERSRATDAIQDILRYINGKYEPNIMASFGIVRGDAFEGVLFSQQAAPQIIQELIMELYKAEVPVRISAATGKLSVVSSKRDTADGPAFHDALKRIDHLRKADSDHWFQVSILTDSPAQPLIDGLLGMLSALTRGWTKKQATIVWAMLQYGCKQSLVSEALDMAPSVVSRQLKAANFEAYQQAWIGLEEYLTQAEENLITSPAAVKPTYTTYFNRANREAEEKNYGLAIELFTKALSLALEIFGEGDSRLGRIYNGLIAAMLDLMSAQTTPPKQKSELVEQTGTYLAKAFDCVKNRPNAQSEYARTLSLNGDYLAFLQEDDDALKEYEEAVQIGTQTDQAAPAWLLDCYNSITAIHVTANRVADAWRAHKNASNYARQLQSAAPSARQASVPIPITLRRRHCKLPKPAPASRKYHPSSKAFRLPQSRL